MSRETRAAARLPHNQETKWDGMWKAPPQVPPGRIGPQEMAADTVRRKALERLLLKAPLNVLHPESG